MNIRLYLALTFAATGACAWGADVTVAAPGGLTAALTEAGIDLAEATDLTVSGTVDAADLFALGNQALRLKTLDLSQADIAAYNGTNINGCPIYPAATVPTGMFAGSPLQTIVLPAGQDIVIGDMAFAGTGLTSLPDFAKVSAIGQGAFSHCDGLVAIDYPATVADIDSHVFAGCAAIETVDLNGADAVAPYAFAGCTALTAVTGADNVADFGSGAFKGCTALTDITFGRSTRSIGADAFQGTALTDLNLTDCTDLSTIGDFAFADCTDLTTVTFDEESAPALGKGTFFGDSKVTDITLPAGLTDIPDYALKGMSQHTLTTLPDYLDRIGDYAMMDNKGVTELKLPITLTQLGDGAMEGMTGLTKINAESLTEVPMLGNDVWAGVDQSHVMLGVSDDMADQFKNAAQWQDFNINSSTGSEGIVADTVNPAAVKARFAGTDLQLQATGVDISTVTLYDVAGRVLVTVQPASDFIVIDTAAFHNPLFIVTVTLDNGTNATLKLKR